MEFSQNIASLRPSATMAVSALAKKLRAEGRDVINLSAGEPDFDTPSWISEAAADGIRAGGTRYTPPAGLPELREAVARTFALLAAGTREVGPEEVVVSCGAKHSLYNACTCLFGPGDDVLVAAPYWTSYPEIVSLARARPLFVRGPEESDFRLTPDHLEAAVTPATRGLVLCTPGNPTGTVYSAGQLRGIAEWARDREIWLISDEIYRSICFVGDAMGGTRAPGLLDLPTESLGSAVVVDGVSKSFAMTGWRIGYTWSSPELARKMTGLQSHTTSNPATPSQLAALAALENPDRARGDVEAMRRAFLRRRDLVTSSMEERLPGVSFIQPQGAFYLFFRIDRFFDEEIPDSQSWCRHLLEQTGVAVVPGAAFGDDRFARLSFATSDEQLTEAVRRMAEVLAPLGSRAAP